MSNDYQTRKDLDRVIRLANQIDEVITKSGVSNLSELLSRYYDSSDVDVRNWKLNDDLKELDGSLTNLSTSLDELSLELYGDASHDGLTDYIDQLQVLIYGKGGTYVKDGVTHQCSIDDPCPNSMKGVLNTLRSETIDLQSSLNALTIGLTSFTMTLEQFKAELARQGISYAELDTGITTLLELIFNAQRRIDSTNNVIGTDTDTSSDGTVFGFLNDTTDTANLASNKATEVRKVLFSGNSDTGTSGNPASGTVKANLNTAQSDISDVQTDIGTVNVSSDGNLQSQINNIYQYEITPILQYGSSTERVTTNFLSNSSMYFKVKAYTRTGTPITTDELTATLMTPRGKVSLTPSKPFPTTDPEIYLFSYFNTGIGYNESGVYVFQIGDASLTCIVEKDTDFDRIYPIGYIYISVNDLNPQYIFGGTWVQLTDTFLYATSGTADENATTAPSGQGEATHTLTTNEMPKHKHDFDRLGRNVTSGSSTAYVGVSYPNGETIYHTTEVGGGQAHNNMPPYMKVYMWKRTG